MDPSRRLMVVTHGTVDCCYMASLQVFSKSFYRGCGTTLLMIMDIQTKQTVALNWAKAVLVEIVVITQWYKKKQKTPSSMQCLCWILNGQYDNNIIFWAELFKLWGTFHVTECTGCTTISGSVCLVSLSSKYKYTHNTLSTVDSMLIYTAITLELLFIAQHYHHYFKWFEITHDDMWGKGYLYRMLFIPGGLFLDCWSSVLFSGSAVGIQ